jgi:hypothetical protein
VTEQPENAAAPNESRSVDEPAAVGPDAPTAGEPVPAEEPPTEQSAAEPDAVAPATDGETTPEPEAAAPETDDETAPEPEVAAPETDGETTPEPEVAAPETDGETMPESAPAVPEPQVYSPTFTTEPIDPAPAWAPPAEPASESLFQSRPELAVGAAFAGGLVLALILKRLAR